MYRLFVVLILFLSFPCNASIEDVFGSCIQSISLGDTLCTEEREWYIKEGKILIEDLVSDKLTQNNMIERLKKRNLNIYERSKSIFDSALRTVDLGSKLYKGFGNAYSYCFGAGKVKIFDIEMTTTEATDLRKKMLQDVILVIWALQSEQKQENYIDTQFQRPPTIKLQGTKAEKILDFLNCYMLLTSQKNDLNDIMAPVSILKDGTQTVYVCDGQTYLQDQGKLDQKLTIKTGKLNVYTGCKSTSGDIEYVVKEAPFEHISDLENTKFVRGIDVIFASNEGTKAILPYNGSAIHFGLLQGEGHNLFIQIEPFGLVDADSQVQYLRRKYYYENKLNRFFTFCHQGLIDNPLVSPYLSPNYTDIKSLAYQGWKIHFPVNEKFAPLGIEVLNYLLDLKVIFKVVPNEETTKEIKSSVLGFGKEIEIYAQTKEQYINLINELDFKIKYFKFTVFYTSFFDQNKFENCVGQQKFLTSIPAILNPEKSNNFQSKNNIFVFPFLAENGKEVMKIVETLNPTHLLAMNERGQFLKFTEKGKQEFGLKNLKYNGKNLILAIPFSEYYPCPFIKDPWILIQKNQDNFTPKIEDLEKVNELKYKEFLRFQEIFKTISPYLEPYI